MGAVLTTPGRASTVRWCGSGKRDEEEYERNRRLKVPQNRTGPEPDGYGPEAVRTRPGGSGRGTPDRFMGGSVGGHGEVLRGSHGDAAGTKSGSSFDKRITVNTGTVQVLPDSRAASAAGRAGSTVDRSVRGGAEPP